MGAKETFKEDYKWFIEAGLVAVNQCDEDAATKLFEAARVLRTDAPEWLMGLGLIAMNKMELDKAAAAFQKVLDKDPNYQQARAFLGFTIGLGDSVAKYYQKVMPEAAEKLKSAHPMEHALELLKEAKTKSSDATVRSFSDNAIEWFTKGIKKSPLEARSGR